MTLSDRQQNSSLEHDRPMGVRRNLNLPDGSRNVVSFELSSWSRDLVVSLRGIELGENARFGVEA